MESIASASCIEVLSNQHLYFCLSRGLVDRNKVPVAVFELVQLLTEFLDPIIVIVIETLFLLLSVCVLFGLSCPVLGRVSWVIVVGYGFCREAGRHISVHCPEFSFASTLARCGLRRWLSWRFVRCLIVVPVISSTNGILHFDNQCAGLCHSCSILGRRRGVG